MWKDAQPYSQLRQCKVNSQQINIFYLLNWKKLSVSENVGKCHSTSGDWSGLPFPSPKIWVVDILKNFNSYDYYSYRIT